MVKNIFDIFKFNAINNPNHPAIILSNNKFISYKNLLNDAENLSYKLSTIGIRKDDPICIISEKSFEAYKLILACIKIGAPYFFLDPDITLKPFSRNLDEIIFPMPFVPPIMIIDLLLFILSYMKIHHQLLFQNLLQN